MGDTYFKKDKTICWECANACSADCEWANELKPVPGWDAEPTVSTAGAESFLVRSCPKFVKDKPDQRRGELNTGGCLAMIEKLMEVTRDDYITGTPSMQLRIEKFLRGKGASKVHMIDNPEDVIKNLKRASGEYKREQEREVILAKLESTIAALEGMPVQRENVEKAYVLLKGQRPKKPVIDEFRNKHCPRCTAVLKGKYCHECGQAVKMNE